MEAIKVYQYPFTLKKGDVLTDGSSDSQLRKFEFETDTEFIWIDLKPRTKFAHPTAYIFLSDKSQEMIKGSWWPVLNGKQILYGSNSGPQEMIKSVERVILTKVDVVPPLLNISVLGTVNSTGWGSPRLSQLVYIKPPQDGIWEFQFMADRPEGIVNTVITPVFALHTIPFPNWKGVRIISSTNSKTVEINETMQPLQTGCFSIEHSGEI